VFEIALIEPEIPGNTGSIGRICVGTGTRLHLVGRLGFDISDRAVKRAGLDYWKHVRLNVEPDVDRWFETHRDRRLHLMSAHGPTRYDRVTYEPGDILVFGGEPRGFPAWLHERFGTAEMIHIPTTGLIRSLNLACAASVVLFEAIRQQGYPGGGDTE